MVLTNRFSILITRMLIRLVDTLVCTPLSDSVLGHAGISYKLVCKGHNYEWRTALYGTEILFG